MDISLLSEDEQSQVVTLPEGTCFPDKVKQVNISVVGMDRVLSPIDNPWDSFFLSKVTATDDFMSEREPDINN